MISNKFIKIYQCFCFLLISGRLNAIILRVIYQTLLNMHTTRILISMLVIMSFSVQARMYQWNDTENGTTQLSGKPPAWYRSESSGPRVIVFDKGEIIDDTSIRVSEDKRKALRLEALLRVEEDREKAREKALAAEQIKANLNKSTKDKDLVNEDQITGPVEEAQPPAVDAEYKSAEQTGAELQMRTLISEWEKQILEKAKEQAGSKYIKLE
jgi:hypothetical protein